MPDEVWVERFGEALSFGSDGEGDLFELARLVAQINRFYRIPEGLELSAKTVVGWAAESYHGYYRFVSGSPPLLRRSETPLDLYEDLQDYFGDFLVDFRDHEDEDELDVFAEIIRPVILYCIRHWNMHGDDRSGAHAAMA